MGYGHTDREQQGRIDTWDQLFRLNGVTIGAKHTGWDRLAQAIVGDATARLRLVWRLEAIVILSRMLSRLRQPHFTVLALRLGLTIDDQPRLERSRQEVSETINLSVSQV